MGYIRIKAKLTGYRNKKGYIAEIKKNKLLN